MLLDGKPCAHMSAVLDHIGAASGWCGLNGIFSGGHGGERINIKHWWKGIRTRRTRGRHAAEVTGP